MNILLFLSPKQDLMYVYDDFTLRQTLGKVGKITATPPFRC